MSEPELYGLNHGEQLRTSLPSPRSLYLMPKAEHGRIGKGRGLVWG
jgi:hypothetical protein